MKRHIPRRLAVLALLAICAVSGTAQQPRSDSGIPALDLKSLTALALSQGGDARNATLSYEQARLQYEQTRAKNGASLAGTAGATETDTYDLLGSTTADSNLSLGTTAKAGLTLTLPETSAGLTIKQRFVPATSGTSTRRRNITAATLSANHTVWDGVWGGTTYLTLQEASATLQSKALALESARKDIEVQVAKAYYTMLSAQRTMDLRDATVRQRTAELDRTKILIEAGKAADVDRRQAEINLKSAEVDRRAAAASLTSAASRLAALAGMESSARFTVREVEDPTLPALDLEAAVRTALESRTDLKQLRLTRSSGDLELRLAKAEASPQVVLSGSTDLYRNWTNDTLGGDWTASLQVSLPMADSGLIRKQIEAKVVQNSVTDGQITDLERKIRLDVADAIAAIDEAVARVDIARLSVEQAELRYELAETQEEVGTGSSLDALDASVEVTSAQVALLKARNDLQLALLTYKQAQGI